MVDAAPASPEEAANTKQTQTPQPPAVPARPALVQGVKLAGQMPESAFKDPPWLVEREDTGYVQVTQLLYQVCEQCTGQQTPAEIAERLTAAGRPVRPETIERLVAQMLIPLGLVAKSDGSAMPTSRTRGLLLAVNMRMKMVSPHLLNPLTRILQWLYFPPVLLAVLVAAVLGQVWLFFVHGVAASTRDALYSPGLLLLLVAFTIVSAGFHELGHAAALRYGGAKVKGMGAGIYLIYPAFYTDVSDNYRLRRWPRVRTDLGGFYFNLIAVLIVIGVYAAVRREFLLLMVVLADFEIFYQLQPFVRLDGYWTLADLTGIPDFFSQMGGFWRSILPLKRWRGTKLPELKWWGKLVFVLYTAITIPLLALVLFLMLKSVPRILGTSWDSFLKLLGQAGTAYGQGNVLSLVADAVQILVLALPTFGTLFVLYRMARGGAAWGWSWSKGSAGRRAVAGLAGVAIVGLVAFLWIPQLPPALFARRSQATAQAQSPWRPISESDRGIVQEAAPAFAAGLVPDVQPVAQPPVRAGNAVAPAAATITASAIPTTSATATPSATASRTPVPTVVGSSGEGCASPVPRVGTSPGAAVASATPCPGIAVRGTAVGTSAGTVIGTATRTVTPFATPLPSRTAIAVPSVRP